MRKEKLYLYFRTRVILYSLIQIDEIKQVYYLDATDKDIERLVITIKAYQDWQLRVVLLNQV